MANRTFRIVVLALLVSAMIVSGVHASSKNDGVLAVLSFRHPKALPTVAQALADNAELKVFELFYVYCGRANTYTGGVRLPLGECPSQAATLATEVHNATLSDLLERPDLPDATRADLQDRLLAAKESGPSVYGLRVSCPAAVVHRIATTLAAERVEITSDPRVLPVYPGECYRAPSTEYLTGRPSTESLVAGKEWVPSSGYLNTYTDGSGYRCFYNTITWNSQSQLDRFGPFQGYEHDVVTYNADGTWARGLQSTSRPTGWDSNMPMPYLDYATGIGDDANYNTYTVGTFRAYWLVPSTQYYTFLRAYPGDALSDPSTKINAQLTDVYGYSVWLVHVIDGQFLATGFTIPGTQCWSFNQ